jgi:hypothetical protein
MAKGPDKESFTDVLFLMAGFEIYKSSVLPDVIVF